MSGRKLRISGCGCGLMDLVYPEVSFAMEAFERYRSRRPGDGGLDPGKLVFVDAFERFCGKRCEAAIAEITRGRPALTSNVGGPAIVALILAAQLLAEAGHSVSFHGAVGNDATGELMLKILRQTPLKLECLISRQGATPSTHVLSDPGYDHGHGERSFINDLGVNATLEANDLDTALFEADVVLFGGTALAPRLHRRLDWMLEQVTRHGGLSVVGTVFDFLNEQSAPSAPWPLGTHDLDWSLPNLLIADHEESLRLSGTDSIDMACAEFVRRGLPAFLITHGHRPVICYASERSRFSPAPLRQISTFPTTAPSGDTTGCGDNFAGGVIAGLAEQLARGIERLDLTAAARLGCGAGAVACDFHGGVKLEQAPGARRREIEELLQADDKASTKYPERQDN